ncbi:MAG: hypothetical protein KC593_01305 [Myxococcales bacterium]|nr:hypothetical protein [Myxococcales bacterium]
MTSPIKPPSGPVLPVDGLSQGAPRATDTGAGADFKTSLERTDAPDAVGVTGASPSTAASASTAADLTAALRAGTVSPSQAVDRLVSEALASADAQLLEPAARVELEQHLRSMLAEDPSLRELVGDLSRT